MGEDSFIGADNIYEVLSYVDASYATHNDMRGRTGGCMAFGCGLNNAKSSKQKLNKKVSTESEIVGAIYYIPFSI